MIWRQHIHKVVFCPPDSWSNWNLEMLVFEERGKPEYPEKNLSEQRRQPTTNYLLRKIYYDVLKLKIKTSNFDQRCQFLFQSVFSTLVVSPFEFKPLRLQALLKPLLDFSKAFDTVPHNRLLHKLNYYDICRKTHRWIKNFLINRSQCAVQVSGERSD